MLEDGTTPTVTVGEYSAVADAASGCVSLDGPAGGSLCDTLDLVVPSGALADGVKDIVVTDPLPVLAASEELVQTEIVGAPAVLAVEPALECNANGDTTLAITGVGFVSLEDGTLPTVSVGTWSGPADAAGDCVPLTGPEGGASCTLLTATVPAGTLGAGLWDVAVANPAPADCVSSEPVQLELVDPPALIAASPALTCLDEAAQTVTLSGAGFVVLADGTLPSVTVGTWSGVPDSAADCVALAGTAGGKAAPRSPLPSRRARSRRAFTPWASTTPTRQIAAASATFPSRSSAHQASFPSRPTSPATTRATSPLRSAAPTSWCSPTARCPW